MNKLISISSRLPLALGLLFISSAPLTIAQTPSAPSRPSQQIWGCRTENGTRIYVVDQLRRNEDNFDVAIYERTGGSGDRSGIEEKYIGTAQVNVSQKEPELIGSGPPLRSKGTINNAKLESIAMAGFQKKSSCSARQLLM